METYGVHFDIHLWMVICLPPILLLTSVRNLKHLTPASLLSNVLMATGTAHQIEGGRKKVKCRLKLDYPHITQEKDVLL